MNSNLQTPQTKLISVFFPLKPLRNKFSNNFISSQISSFIPKLNKFTEKTIVYKIDKEIFYTYDLNKEKFDNSSEIVENQTIVVIFSVNKTENVDLSSMFEEDFFKNINTIRVHRKRIDHLTLNSKPSYIFYTINSTKLLNNIVPLLNGNSSKEGEPVGGKTYFILSANNAKRDIDPLEKSFSTEKICRMNYIITVDLKKELKADLLETRYWLEDDLSKLLRKKIGSQIKN
jgi:hypothetical protein